MPEFIDLRFRENKPKALVFSHRQRAFWACFHENWVYKFGQQLSYDLASFPSPPPLPVSKLDRGNTQDTGRLRKRDNLLTGGG